jgi:preprotein translocase SecE subunit
MSISTYVKETRAELVHVKWPTQKQAIGFTLLVIGLSILVAIILGAFDYLFSLIVTKFVL